MADVTPYQKKPGLTQQLIPIAASVGGGMLGGPAGAAAGGMLGNRLADGGPQVAPVQNGAIERRLAPPPPAATSNPSEDLANADQALAYLPPEQQQKYGPIIRRARAIDQQQQTGVA